MHQEAGGLPLPQDSPTPPRTPSLPPTPHPAPREAPRTVTFHGAFCSKGLQPGGTRERTPKGTTIGWRDSLEAFQEPFLLDPEPRLGELHFPLGNGGSGEKTPWLASPRQGWECSLSFQTQRNRDLGSEQMPLSWRTPPALALLSAPPRPPLLSTPVGGRTLQSPLRVRKLGRARVISPIREPPPWLGSQRRVPLVGRSGAWARPLLLWAGLQVPGQSGSPLLMGQPGWAPEGQP